MYQTPPVLPPGSYKLDVYTKAQILDASSQQPTQPDHWETASATFHVGSPAGLNATAASPPGNQHYPGGGPLNDLATYVGDTLPEKGTTPFYRKLDAGVRFSQTYVSQMYLQAQSPLSLYVVDANETAERSDAHNVWDSADSLDLTAYQLGFVQTLQGDGASPCASVDVTSIVKPQQVFAAGPLLSPARLHRTELQSSAAPVKPLFSADFTTSKYANLRHQLATYSGACATTTAGAPFASALAAVSLAPGATAPGFEALYKAAMGATPPPALPSGVAVSRIVSPDGKASVTLIESDEPIPWSRISAILSSAVQAPRRVVMPIDRSFGSPDQGQVVQMPACTVTSDSELQLIQTALDAYYVQPRVPGQKATVTIATTGASSLSATVVVKPKGTVSLISQPAAPATDPPAQGSTADASGDPTANPATLTLPNPVTAKAILQGNDFGFTLLAVTELFAPIAPTGPVRIIACILPTPVNQQGYSVDLAGLDNVDLSGWTIQWWDLVNPKDAAQTLMYFQPSTAASPAAGSNPNQLSEGTQIRIYPGLSTPPTPVDTDVDGVIVWGGGIAPPSTGALLQLVDPVGVVRHEWVAAPSGQTTSLTVLPNEDNTRALLVGGSVQDGTSMLILTMDLSPTDPSLATWTIGGASSPEIARVCLTAKPSALPPAVPGKKRPPRPATTPVKLQPR